MDRDWVRPRLSAVLAPWLRAWRCGWTSADDAVDAVREAGGPEQLVCAVEAPDRPLDLFEQLSGLARADPESIRLVLAVPGDVRGLPRSGAFAAAALEAGEAVVAADRGLVPVRLSRVSGSGQRWHVIQWTAFRLEASPQAGVELAAAEADTALSEAMRQAAAVLAEVDAAPWDGRGRGPAAAARSAGPQLPPGFSPRARRLYARATAMDLAVREAEADALGGAVTAAEAETRRMALRPLGAAARHGLASACHDRLS